jgi:hypothetical protein
VTRLDDLSTGRPAGDDPDGTKPGSAPRTPASSRVRPAHVAVALVFATALWLAVTPINDIDSYWHVPIGREILARHTVDGLGTAWLGVPADTWRTSQWLSEVVMALGVDHVGWGALTALRLLAGAALYLVLVLTLVRRRQPIAALVVVLGVVISVGGLLQDRPATLSLVFLALLGPACERLWTTGSRPPVVAVAAAAVVWAQCHGLWILAPAAFALVAVGALVDRGRAAPGQLRGALICAAASCAGVVNPFGPSAFLLPLRFQSAAGVHIVEWLAPTFTSSLTIPWGILVLLLIFAWVRSPVRVPDTELIWTAAWTVFGLSAWRNVGPVVLLTAPVVLRALERSFTPVLEKMSAHPSRRVSRVLAGVVAVTVAVGVLGTVLTWYRVDPLKKTPALAIAQELAGVPGQVRVYNGYNASGSLVAFGGGSSGHLLLVVDGRSDLWGNDHIQEVTDAQNLAPGWEGGFTAFHPDAVVMPDGTPLVMLLLGERHWNVLRRDGDYVLLVPPGSRLLRH